VGWVDNLAIHLSFLPMFFKTAKKASDGGIDNYCPIMEFKKLDLLKYTHDVLEAISKPYLGFITY